MECFLDWEFLMAASSNQKHAHFIPFKPTPKTFVIQIYKKDSTEQIHTSDKKYGKYLVPFIYRFIITFAFTVVQFINSETLFFFAHNSIDFKSKNSPEVRFR